jgi:hypothetical protein
MLTQNLLLDDKTGDEITFNLQSYLPDGSRRVDITSTYTDERALEIRHTSSGKAGNVVDRHLISAFVTKQDSAGIPRKGVVNVTFTLPRSAAVSQDDVIDLFAVIVDLACDGGFSSAGISGTANLSAILRGES